MRQYDKIFGGELPLSQQDCESWLTAGPYGKSFSDLMGRLGLSEKHSMWVHFGRSALGCVLDAVGITATDKVSAPAYQCSVVFEKMLSRGSQLQVYPLGPDLSPEPQAFFGCAKTSALMLTNSYFGSQRNDQMLVELWHGLQGFAKAPWIVEDRAMASPHTLKDAFKAGRCDFIITSFRKNYPVPDGAVLVGVSERAQEALSLYKQRQITRQNMGALQDVILEKVAAKYKRHRWIQGEVILDDLEVNGLRECIASEKAIDLFANDMTFDVDPGNANSAGWLAGQSFDKDYQKLKKRTKMVVEMFRGDARNVIPVTDAIGLGLPLLIEKRDLFLDAAAEKGIFLPIHWPCDGAMMQNIQSQCTVARHWYTREVTLPILPYHDDSEFEFALNELVPLINKFADPSVGLQ